jgi:enoyl-[acyl-carrier protein] reductase II
MPNRICELLGIEVPIIQAGMSLFTSAELVAAVSNAGALGSLGCWRRPADDLARQVAMIRERTDRPFAINHIVPALDEAAFALTLKVRPKLISLALGDPGELVKRAHDAGSKVMQQVTTVAQARQAAERGVDLVVAQGSDGGGYVGTVGALALIPQVVDAVRPLPVVAAGGIADGRGLAAALMLGAEAINIGTRFLACEESPVSTAWKRSIVNAAAEDAIRVEVLNDIMPMPGSFGYGTVLRSLRSPFIEAWIERRAEARRDSERLRAELVQLTQQGRIGEAFPAAGQSAGLIREILPTGEIVRRIVDEARGLLAAQVARTLS